MNPLDMYARAQDYLTITTDIDIIHSDYSAGTFLPYALRHIICLTAYVKSMSSMPTKLSWHPTPQIWKPIAAPFLVRSFELMAKE